MRVSIIAFTARGASLARRIELGLAAAGEEVHAACPERFAAPAELEVAGPLASWCAEAWERSEALVFVGALGICVRAIAPHVEDKYRDPAVVCVDELSCHAIAVLSGHVGGAGELCRRVARLTGAEEVISTATDLNDVFAVDVWAKEQGLALCDRESATRVSATLLEGATVGLASDHPIAGPLPQGLVWDGGAEHEVGICVSERIDVRPFACTLNLVPRTVTVGIGCRRGADAAQIAHAVDTCLANARIAPEAVCAVSTIDVKESEPGLLAFCHERGLALETHMAQELAAVPGMFASSAFVLETVGVDNVSERAACAAGGTLISPKRIVGPVTVALAQSTCTLRFPERAPEERPGWVAVVGLGPSAGHSMTVEAAATLDACDIISGYATYVDLVERDWARKELLRWPMRSEVRRAQDALERAAQGSRVAVVCAGDAGVYGMAGIVCELAEGTGVEVRVVAGVTAATAGAALLGAPLGHDWCVISLSDLLTDWDVIERRLEAAAAADLVVCLYNPGSAGRRDHLRRACEVLLRHKDPECVCGIARNIGRDGQETRTLTLEELAEAEVDMSCTVFVGNRDTRVVAGRMVTPRGYATDGQVHP